MKKFIFCMFFFVLIAGMLSFAFSEENKSDDTTEVKGKTLLQTVLDGGIMMIIIGLVSVVMMAIVMRGFIIISERKLIPEAFVTSVEESVGKGDIQSAIEVCESNQSFFSKILLSGFKKMHMGHASMEKAIEERGEREGEALKVTINYLSVIATIAPMLGLLGTVSGMIKSFNAIAFSGAAGKPSLLAASVGEALVTTAFGLVVAIPAMAFYFFFKTRVANAVAISEEKIETILDRIHENGLYETTENTARENSIQRENKDVSGVEQ